MAAREYNLLGKVVISSFCVLISAVELQAEEKLSTSLTLSPADTPFCAKLSSSNTKGSLQQDYQEEQEISLSELKRKLAKEAIYKTKEVAEDRNWWYLSLPLTTITEALDSAEAFREYLSRAFSADTRVKISDKEIGFFIKKRF